MSNGRSRRGAHPRAAENALEVRQLRAFVALVDHGSVTAAAHALGLAQSTVSESLSALERALGTAVVVRRRGAAEVLLTAAGGALLPHARSVLAAIEDAQIAVAGASTTAHAAVDIVANESVSTYVLPGALAGLRRRWPNVRFSVSVATCPGVRAGVEDGAFDLGLMLEAQDASATSGDATAPSARPRRDSPAAESLLVVPEVALVVFATPTHPLASPLAARGATHLGIRRDRLDAFPLFVSDAAGDFHTLVRDFFTADGLPGPHLESTGSVEGVKRGVATDPQALGLLPVYAILDELRSGRLAPIDVRPAPPRMRLDALLSRSRPRHPAIGELLESVRAVFSTARPVGAAGPSGGPSSRADRAERAG